MYLHYLISLCFLVLVYKYFICICLSVCLSLSLSVSLCLSLSLSLSLSLMLSSITDSVALLPYGATAGDREGSVGDDVLVAVVDNPIGITCDCQISNRIFVRIYISACFTVY